MKFKPAAALVAGLFAACAQAAVFNGQDTLADVVASDASLYAGDSFTSKAASELAQGSESTLTADETAAQAESLRMPEPENYVALAASLGLIGFVSARRRNR
ncbi:MAG: hypothetical protein EOP35_07705 [Rubrivivax sp.]|nr:MAG: hypothetical protein EOP35_07705 [Rubrivivax sp.]